MERQLALFTVNVETFVFGSVLIRQTTYVRWDGIVIDIHFQYKRIE